MPKTDGRPYPHAVLGNDDDRSIAHRIRAAVDQASHSIRSLRRGHFHEAHNARMRQSSQENQFSKVLVLRNEHSLFRAGERKQRLVRGVRKALADIQNVLPEVRQS